MTKTELLTARQLHSNNSCKTVCLFCGSGDNYICKDIVIGDNYLELENKCDACNHIWVDLLDRDGVLKDIRIPNLGVSWQPIDLK